MAEVAADIPADVAPGERVASGSLAATALVAPRMAAAEAPTSEPQAVESPAVESPAVEVPDVEAQALHESQLPAGCTQAQLRRFIKSRPYVPMHELRRRFELNGLADEVTRVVIPQGSVYVGLPGRESRFIAELVRSGDIGLELSHDPPVPIVIGVYAMRPVSR